MLQCRGKVTQVLQHKVRMATGRAPVVHLQGQAGLQTRGVRAGNVCRRSVAYVHGLPRGHAKGCQRAAKCLHLTLGDAGLVRKGEPVEQVAHP
jgi:hypothetical protein